MIIHWFPSPYGLNEENKINSFHSNDYFEGARLCSGVMPDWAGLLRLTLFWTLLIGKKSVRWVTFFFPKQFRKYPKEVSFSLRYIVTLLKTIAFIGPKIFLLSLRGSFLWNWNKNPLLQIISLGQRKYEHHSFKSNMEQCQRLKMMPSWRK